MKDTEKQIKFKRRSIRESDLSIHSKLSYFLGLLTIVIQFYLGFSHITDVDYAGQYFGTMSIIEGIFCLVGMFLPDILKFKRFDLYPGDRFRPLTSKTALVFMICLSLNIIIQIIIQIPLTIRDIEMALAIVFAAPAEELFFRAFLIGIFDRISDEVEEDKLSRKTGISALSIILSGTVFGIFSWFFTSTLFALFHVNYYNDIRLMLIVFLGGMVYSIAYWKMRDITGCILAHFALNIYAVVQIFGLAGFQFGL